MRRLVVLCSSIALGALTLAPGAALGQSPAGGWDPSAITGTVRLSGWESSPAEGAALEATLAGFAEAYPDITVDYQPIPGDYPAAMAANFAGSLL